MASGTRDPVWAVTPEKVEAAVRRIAEVSRPEMIILFGSYVRGTQDRNSDLDVLVITADTVTDPRRESVRIRRALRDIPMAMDILVVPRSRWDQLKETPGLIYREALQTGKVVYGSAEAA
jgi:predicted nucleotidyltransferase